MTKKKCTTILFLVALWVGGIFILSWKCKPKVPQISVDRSEINLGVFDSKSEPQIVEFEISNKGTAPLVIDKIITGCPCLEPRIEKNVLNPGEKTLLAINVSVPLTTGKWQDTLLLSSNDPKQKTIPIKITAFIEVRCNIEPKSVNVQLRKNDSRKVELKVFGPTEDFSFGVDDVTCDNDNFRLSKIHDAKLSETGKRRIVPIDILISNKTNKYWEDIIFVHNSDSKMPIIEVPVTVRVISDIICKPPIVSLFRNSSSQDINGSFEISYRGEEHPIKSYEVQSTSWLDIQEDESQSYNKYKRKFRVFINKKMPQGLHKGEISIRLKGSATPIKVPVLLFNE